MALQDAFGFDGKTYSGQEFRLAVAAATGGQSGMSKFTDMAATPQGSPNNTVSVSAGTAIIPATHAGDLGSYEVPNDAALTSPTFAATGANGRWDLLILEVIAGVPQLTVVQGTASGSPVYPSLAAHDNYVVVCGVKMPANKSIIDNGANGTIDDRRGIWLPYFICSSTTRPPIPYDGQMIEETDTERVYIWDAGNSQWAPSRLYIGTAASLPAAPKQGTPAYVSDANLPSGSVAPMASARANAPGLYVFDARWDPPWNLPWGIMGILEATANQGSITAEVDATGLTTLTFTAVANRRIKIWCEWLGAVSTSTNDLIQVRIKEGATQLNMREMLLPGVDPEQGSHLSRVITPSAGAHTYKVTFQRVGAGTVTVSGSSTAPIVLCAEDIGPNGQPA